MLVVFNFFGLVIRLLKYFLLIIVIIFELIESVLIVLEIVSKWFVFLIEEIIVFLLRGFRVFKLIILIE